MHQSVLKGYLLALAAIVILSPDALLIRLAGDEPFLITTWRGIIGGIMVLIFTRFLDKRTLLEQIKPARYGFLAVVAINAVQQFCFVYAISHSNVTDVLVILAFAPLAGAFLSALFLHENVALRTWIATIVCGVGLAILFLQPDSNSESGGLIAAVICALTLASQFVVMRGHPKANLTAGIGVGNILTGFICAFLVADIIPDSSQWLPLLAMGLIVAPLPFVLLAFSLRYISAAETSLIMLLETVLGSLLVWVILSEQPSVQTVLAGILILSTLSVYTWLTLRASANKPGP
uniref:EamA domain-containing protein n=1 Tax=uncultured Thiotrichaceae bacterium TaxID=298394 RepID=A0A6S6UFL6_9GAMM|nr:MAG: Unknown protein [uncultured Thiotrichaceae bacterium]